VKIILCTDIDCKARKEWYVWTIIVQLEKIMVCIANKCEAENWMY
jgi:hypothetical protein